MTGFRLNLLRRRAPLALAMYWPALMVATHWPGLTVAHNDLAGGVFQLDKIAHAIAFALLTLLLTLALRGRALPAMLIAAAYAAVDEYTQQWVGRQVAASDITASLIGVVATFVLIWTPARAPLSRLALWQVIIARTVAVVVTPPLTLLVTLPAGNPFVVRFVSLFTVEPGLDKWLHFWLATVLTWLLVLAAPAGRNRPRLSAAIAIALLAVAAPVIEIVQRETGRGFEVADVFAHETGLLAALAGWAGVLMWRRLWSRLQNAQPAVAPIAPVTPPDTAGSTDAAGTQPANPTPASSGFVGHAMTVGALTLVSRITGLGRDAVLAAVFGLGAVADAFFIGFLVPNLFRRLFGEGALSAAFIPHYTELLQQDRDLARRFATLCLTLLTIVLCALTVVGELILAWLWHATDGESLAVRLTMIMLPYMPLICLVALIGGVLQVHRRFGPPAAAPVVLNLIMIAAALWAAMGVHDSTALDGAAVAVALSVLIAGLFQLLWQTAAMVRHAPLTFSFVGTWPTLRSMLVMMLPMLIGLAVFQINAFMDSLIAFGLSSRPGGPTHFHALGYAIHYPMHSGAVAGLQWAQRLYQFPLGVFGIAIATAIFPALAAAVGPDADRPTDQFAPILRQGLRLTVFIGLPASVGLILLRLPLSRLVYERGAFTLDDARLVATILAGYATSIWAYSMTHVLTRGFYALKDSRTPLRISLVMVGFNLTLNAVLIWPLGAAGLAWSTAISAMGQVALLLLAIRKRVPRPVNVDVLSGWGRTAGLTAMMAAALAPFILRLDLASLTFVPLAATVAGLVALGVAVVFAGAWLTGAEELTWLTRRGVNRRG